MNNLKSEVLFNRVLIWLALSYLSLAANPDGIAWKLAIGCAVWNFICSVMAAMEDA